MKNKRKLDEQRASLNVMISSFWGQGVYIEREHMTFNFGENSSMLF